ncbi:hypothetical protein [Thalassotalea fusca]
MDFSQSEVRIINRSIQHVNNWRWYKWILVSTLLMLLGFCWYLFTERDMIRFVPIIGAPIGLVFGYLLHNWSTPKKESLLLKLVKLQSAPNKSLK